jgi:hypothetical protein
MDESYWLGNDSEDMLDSLRDQVSDRQQRLMVCACVRLFWEDLEDDRSRKAVEVGELYADGRATEEELAAARTNAMAVLTEREEEVEEEYQDMEEMYPGCDNEVYDLDKDYAHSIAAAAEIAAAIKADPSDCQFVLFPVDSDFDKYAAWAKVLRGILGNPWRPLPQRQFPANIRGLAQECYDGNHSLFGLLADYLEEVGEVQAAAHCRKGGHVKGCHVLDWVLGKYEPVPRHSSLIPTGPWRVSAVSPFGLER